MVSTVTTADRNSLDPDEDSPGWAFRWIQADPVRAVAMALILVQVLWRAQIGSRGYLAFDDFQLVSQATGTELTSGHLLTFFNNHLMPAALLFMWYITKTLGLVYWPYLLFMILGQAVLSVAFYRLLRQLLPDGWGLLVPLAIFLFSPLNLETTSWWVFGMYMMPLQLSMVWAMGAQIKYVRTGRKRHLVSLGLSMIFGMLFAEKAILILPLAAGLTACLLVRGSTGRSIWRTLTRYWPSWLVLGVLTGAYLSVYMTRAQSSLRRPASVDEVITFLGQYFGHTLTPGLLGGPWKWFEGPAVPPVTDTGTLLHPLSWLAFGVLVGWTIWRRRSAGRAWVLFAMYAGGAALLISATRMGYFLTPVAGLVPRYTADVVIVAAVCVGAAMFGVRGVADRHPPRPVPWWPEGNLGRVLTPAATAILTLVLGVGAIVSTARYSDVWARQAGRDYMATAEKELAKAPAETVFLDEIVPETVMMGASAPQNRYSNFFRSLRRDMVFVLEAENPSVFDEKGQIRPAKLDGVSAKPPADPNCGYGVENGHPVTVPLTGPAGLWTTTGRMEYLISTDTPVTVRLGKGSYTFLAKKGAHQVFFPISGEGDSIELTVTNPGVKLCAYKVAIGTVSAG